MDAHRKANYDNWQERAPLHAAPGGYDSYRLLQEDPQALSGVVAYDAPRLGDLTGLRAIHLQCHIGTDTLSLARLGATVTGLDFSEEGLAAAQRLFDATGTPGRFVHSDVYEAAAALDGERFDLVYTGVGALNWLPDVARWAKVIAALLAPGGRLFLRECHPMLASLDDEREDDLLVVAHPYFEVDEPNRWDSPTSYANREAVVRNSVTFEWNHGLGQVVTAVLDAGLRLDALVEHTEVEWQALPFLVEVGHGRYALPAGRERLPLMYTLMASAPG
jgi:SAM-dependent methyltransferase